MNSKIHYHVCKSPPLESTVSQLNPVHILTPYFFRAHFNIILSIPSELFISSFSTKLYYPPMSPKWSLYYVSISVSLIYDVSGTHLILLELNTMVLEGHLNGKTLSGKCQYVSVLVLLIVAYGCLGNMTQGLHMALHNITIYHWRSWCKGWILRPTPYKCIHTS
jgi:hypothetical protein